MKLTTISIKDSATLKWNSARYVYLASADQWLNLEIFFKRGPLRQCDVFYCVIGGLGGLNFLPLIGHVEKIIFYDANACAAGILELQVQLIRHCGSIDEYISLIYLRPFDRLKYCLENQHDFLQLPVVETYLLTLKSFLTKEAFEVYTSFYLPYIRQASLPLYNGPTIHCTRLLPFLASDSPLVYPFDAKKVNTNTFYVGRGWLSTDETFLATRHQLLNERNEILIGSIESISRMGFEGASPGIYSSNIFGLKPENAGYKPFIDSVSWIAGYGGKLRDGVLYYT